MGPDGGTMSRIGDPETIEEELELFAEAVRLGIDPFPPRRVRGRILRLSLGWFMIIIILSWVSQFLYRAM